VTRVNDDHLSFKRGKVKVIKLKRRGRQRWHGSTTEDKQHKSTDEGNLAARKKRTTAEYGHTLFLYRNTRGKHEDIKL
jgi:hypothetical protein